MSLYFDFCFCSTNFFPIFGKTHIFWLFSLLATPLKPLITQSYGQGPTGTLTIGLEEWLPLRGSRCNSSIMFKFCSRTTLSILYTFSSKKGGGKRKKEIGLPSLNLLIDQNHWRKHMFSRNGTVPATIHTHLPQRPKNCGVQEHQIAAKSSLSWFLLRSWSNWQIDVHWILKALKWEQKQIY